MAAFSIELPEINGEIEAGITVGVDASLPDEKKLPIRHIGNLPGTHSIIKTHALSWALTQYNDREARRMFMNGIAGILDIGAVRHTNNIPDGDWKKIQVMTEPAEAEAADIKNRIIEIVTRDEIVRAITIAVATKANYWLMNHHTGQGAVAGYVKKVLDLFYRDNVTEQMVSAAHTLGHFASTLGILSMAGIRNIRPSVPITQAEGSGLKLSADAKLRFSSMPAGTHKCGVAFEAARRLVRSVYAQYCPNVEEFVQIPQIKGEIMKNPAAYHIGASYLTGLPRADYADTEMESYLGRLGTFITTLYKNSTIAKSPHMVIARVESYEDYDADFKATLIRIQQAQATARGRIVEESIGITAAISPELLQNIRDVYRVAASRGLN